MVFVNTILVQSVLKEPPGSTGSPTPTGALPLFWTHANLYGTIQIDMDIRLDLVLAA